MTSRLPHNHFDKSSSIKIRSAASFAISVPFSHGDTYIAAFNAGRHSRHRPPWLQTLSFFKALTTASFAWKHTVKRVVL
jgi:hypothetical protein